jgi:2'-5' RNA ligase
MKRLFAAIKIDTGDKLSEVYHGLKIKLSHERIKWVELQNLHTTLKFFGETHEEKIEDICAMLSDCAHDHKPFELLLQNTGIFGSSYQPRVIWFGMENTQALEKLANDVLQGAERIGWQRDRQNFRPHLTVGRIKYLDDKRYFQQVIDSYKNVNLQKITVSSFSLIESRLKPQGPEYQIVERFDLG